MTKQEKLKQLINNIVLPEVEEEIDFLFETVASKKATMDDKAKVKELQEMQKEFLAIVEEIDAGEIDDEECDEIRAELEVILDLED